MRIEKYKQIITQMLKEKEINHMCDLLTEKDKEVIINHADQLLKNIFIFNKTWDMEPCLQEYQLQDEIDWESYPNGDEEWCFMLNRMDYLNYLMLATIIKKDITYQLKGKKLIIEWMKHHEVIAPMRSTRTLDTGIRILNIVECLPFLYESKCLDQSEMQYICDSLRKQVYYLKENYLNKYISSNWGSIQLCSILSTLPFLEDNFKEHPLFTWAMIEINKCLSIQIYSDGTHWEQSTMYHVEVLNYLMKLIYYSRIFGYKGMEKIYNYAYQMAKSLLFLSTPKKEIESFGDSDRTNLQDVFCRAAVIFNDRAFKYIGFQKMDYESIYGMGCKAAITYRRLMEQTPNEYFFDALDSGIFTVRSGWGENDHFTMFLNGALGSGHGHSDNLHLSLYYRGVPFLIDSGRFSYREDFYLREYLKGMEAHNGLIMDQSVCCCPNGSWDYSNFGLPLKNYVRHESGIHYYESYFLGNNPYYITIRKLIVLDKGIWIILDDIYCEGRHCVKQRFHLDPEIRIELKANGIICPKLNLKMLFSEPFLIEQSKCSIQYNKLLENAVIVTSSDFVNQDHLNVVICDANMKVRKVHVLQDNKNVLDQDVVYYIKIEVSENESYSVAVLNQEIYTGRKILFLEDMPFHCKCFVIHEKQGEKKGYRLKM